MIHRHKPGIKVFVLHDSMGPHGEWAKIAEWDGDIARVVYPNGTFDWVEACFIRLEDPRAGELPDDTDMLNRLAQKFMPH